MKTDKNIEIYDMLEDIVTIIKDNLYLLLLKDDYLVDLKEYCKEDLALCFTPYGDIIYFVREAMEDLLRVGYLYDFREGLE